MDLWCMCTTPMQASTHACTDAGAHTHTCRQTETCTVPECGDGASHALPSSCTAVVWMACSWPAGCLPTHLPVCLLARLPAHLPACLPTCLRKPCFLSSLVCLQACRCSLHGRHARRPHAAGAARHPGQGESWLLCVALCFML